MSTGTDVDALVAALQANWTTRFAERLRGAGDVTVTVAPPDIQDMGYHGVPCPPARKIYGGAVLIAAATSDSVGARDLLDVLDQVAADCWAAGWTPRSAEAVDVDDRPGYVLTLTRTGAKP